jgi:glycosyltransferase involved in cell wall biosynthesis
VSDYAFTMAAALAPAGPVHVWCPRTDAAAPAAAGVTVHPILQSFSAGELRQLGCELDAHPAPRRLFVQWTPQAFGWRSVNLGVAAWLSARARRHGDIVHLMVHEPLLPWSTRPAHPAAAVLHRIMLTLAARHASRVWISTESWRPIVRRFVPAGTPIDWLPIPAPDCASDTMPRRQGARPVRTVGHFGTYGPLIGPLLQRAVDVVLTQTDARVLLIGRGSDEFRRTLTRMRADAANRIDATGALERDALVASLRECDLMLQPYPDGVTTRRTSAVTLLALGLPVVTNLGALSEPFWSGSTAAGIVASPDAIAIGELASDLLADDRTRSELGERGRELYQARFAVRHAVALLTHAIEADRHAA